MKRIDTEYGSIYSGTPEELEKVSSSSGLEPEKRLDENKYRASWVWVTVIGLGLFLGGFFIGLVLMGDPDFRITGFITITILAVVLGAARRELIKYESAYIDMVHEARDEEMKLLVKRQQVATLEAKKFNAARQVAKEMGKTNVNGLAFTSNDFDDTAQALLLKPVKEARKKKLRVTGQGLIETILKGIH